MNSEHSKPTAAPSTATGRPPAEWKRREMKGIPASLSALWTLRTDGGWRYGVQLDASHCNAQGVVHGGVLMSFMDHALSLLIWEATERATCTTVQLDNHFFHAVRPPAFIECDGKILRRGRKLAFLRGVLRENGRDIMEATGVWSIATPPGA